MPNSMSKASTFWPGKYSARLAKALENEDKAEKSAQHEDTMESQSESSGSTQIEREDVLPGRDGQSGSRRGSKLLHKPDRQTELVNSSPHRLYQSRNFANNRPAGQVKQEPFKRLSKREEETGRCRKAERKTTERLIKRRLARDIEALKREVEDLEQMVAQQASLSERRKGKRVSFHEDAS
ncbi:hypothetical protein N7451_012892 [Penicillium sp. IBT 35674x]|nr:hypothetical protein N7451_012892 [Penicillium sp. IBT 35674x]